MLREITLPQITQLINGGARLWIQVVSEAKACIAFQAKPFTDHLLFELLLSIPYNNLQKFLFKTHQWD